MSTTAGQGNRSAAVELWRVAESGDIESLAQISLPDVNARNKHGATALMKAARNGHDQMVHALLERGADPNLARNDRFTALALAAFFGHTETVRILLEHGAKPEVITRCGASARTWATARTFAEVVDCLEAAAPAPAISVPAPVVIKTLKDPPEIWDLVHEVPRGFNARSAFVSRLKSMKASFAFRIAAVAVVSVVCVVGALVLTGSQARNLPAERTQAPKASEGTTLVRVESKNALTTDPSAPEVAEFSHHPEATNGSDKRFRKVLSLPRQTRTRSSSDDEESVPSVRTEVAAPPAIATSPQPEPRNSNKTSSALSPQLITPAKTDSPKAKVIQWP